MDYGRIVNRSFEIAWKYKSLWIFGLFASGGQGNFNFDLPTRDMSSLTSGDFQIFDIPPEFVSMFILSATLLAVVLFVLNLIAEAAIIDSVNRIDRGGTYRFGDAFSVAVDFFLRFFGLALLEIFGIAVPIVFLIFIAVIAFSIHAALGFLSLLLIVPAIFFVIFTVANIIALARRVVVVRNTSIGDGLEEGYHLLRARFANLLVLFLIFIGFVIAFGIATMIIWAIFGLPVAALGLAADMNPIAAFFGALLAGLPVSIVVGGFLGVFYNCLYTLFYFELVEPKQESAPAAPASPTV